MISHLAVPRKLLSIRPRRWLNNGLDTCVASICIPANRPAVPQGNWNWADLGKQRPLHPIRSDPIPAYPVRHMWQQQALSKVSSLKFSSSYGDAGEKSNLSFPPFFWLLGIKFGEAAAYYTQFKLTPRLQFYWHFSGWIPWPFGWPREMQPNFLRKRKTEGRKFLIFSSVFPFPLRPDCGLWNTFDIQKYGWICISAGFSFF